MKRNKTYVLTNEAFKTGSLSAEQLESSTSIILSVHSKTRQKTIFVQQAREAVNVSKRKINIELLITELEKDHFIKGCKNGE